MTHSFDIANITAFIPWLILWGLLIGLIYSLVGAAGGILSSFGLITVFGLQDPNLVKPMAQSLTLVTPLIAVPLYMRQCRVIYRLAALLGTGGIIGAIIGSTLSSIWLADMSLFKPAFAVLVFFITGQMAWQLLKQSKDNHQLTQTMRAAECFERHLKQGGEACELGVKCLHLSLTKASFRFGNQTFTFNPMLPFFTGMGVAIFSSAFGVGGGFLLVPFMSIILRLPMSIIAGTSALAITMHSLASIANYMRIGVELDYALLGFMMIGIVVGSAMGPLISRWIPETGLRAILCMILFFIGLKYAGVF